jgi:hypothetical protein
MTGKEDWTIEEIYAIGEWLNIPENELLSFFPRRMQQSEKKKITKIKVL